MTEKNSGVQQKKLMSEKNLEYYTGKKEVEVGTLLLRNDKNNVITNKLLNYF